MLVCYSFSYFIALMLLWRGGEGGREGGDE